jgi:hypothetical protein
VPDRTAARWATEPKVRAKIKAYRRRALDRAVGRLAGMVQIVCFGRNMLWRHMKVAFGAAKGDTATEATLHCNLLLNHAPFRAWFKAGAERVTRSWSGGHSCPPETRATDRNVRPTEAPLSSEPCPIQDISNGDKSGHF